MTSRCAWPKNLGEIDIFRGSQSENELIPKVVVEFQSIVDNSITVKNSLLTISVAN